MLSPGRVLAGEGARRGSPRQREKEKGDTDSGAEKCADIDGPRRGGRRQGGAGEMARVDADLLIPCSTICLARSAFSAAIHQTGQLDLIFNGGRLGRARHALERANCAGHGNVRPVRPAKYCPCTPIDSSRGATGLEHSGNWDRLLYRLLGSFLARAGETSATLPAFRACSRPWTRRRKSLAQAGADSITDAEPHFMRTAHGCFTSSATCSA